MIKLNLPFNPCEAFRLNPIQTILKNKSTIKRCIIGTNWNTAIVWWSAITPLDKYIVNQKNKIGIKSPTCHNVVVYCQGEIKVKKISLR